MPGRFVLLDDCIAHDSGFRCVLVKCEDDFVYRVAQIEQLQMRL
jgi:hypothetical protein